ncbi:methyltransferase domain-containing protein [Flexivirga sp. ID2601S]|uniref:Methyltransferase domain-containing protein n=1 Tax=Flexivirga aerilata TaxID=1656889 RepID=A0A849AGM3_9MICO|nr:bifunctional PIG-L family deacetylase/class I SAM-dependent methyltransferase [Flexivirga aerilata]NNG38358.1 methyltransferase domain-containing protein [Flexivirga aerilata]
MTATFRHDEPGTPAAHWSTDPDEQVDFDGIDRVLVVAAHPDDESLGAGGLIATAAARRLPVEVVILTAGEGSHPHSSTHDRSILATLRRVEARHAASALGLPYGAVTVGQIPDGEVRQASDEIVTALVRRLGDPRDPRRTLIVAPYRHDGHPDHEAAGRAAAIAAHRTDSQLLEYPIWFRHVGLPSTLPEGKLVGLDLETDAHSAKLAAIAAHCSQLQPLSKEPGDEPILLPDFLEHFTGMTELFIRSELGTDDRLEQLHRDAGEPWGADTRWYEARKRQILLGMLPRARFARTLEIGCSTGVLTGELARRSDALEALDSAQTAVAAARARVTDAHVRVRYGSTPADLPDGETFDLVVCSEIGYFLSPDALRGTIDRIGELLTDDGVVALAHWRHPIDGWPLDADAVHAAFAAAQLPPVSAVYRDRDVEIVIHCAAECLPDPTA